MKNHQYPKMAYQPTGLVITIPLYTFEELSEDARNRVVSDYVEERANDPYLAQYFADCYESDIWHCVKDLESNISGARVSWQYNRWYSCYFDCEYSYDDCYDPSKLSTIEDNGYCYSMDICDAWNAHIRKLNTIYYRVDYLDHLLWDVYNDWDAFERRFDPNAKFSARLDRMRDDLISQWYEELEKACDDVRDAIEILLRGEWDYYTSEEYARMECEDETAQGYECRTIDNTGRMYYYDTRKWYTIDGELYEQSSIIHECVSIVKTEDQR